MSMRIQKNQSDNLIRETYAMAGEKTYEDVVRRICQLRYFDDEAQQQRMIGYLLKKWMIPSSPVMMNLGTHIYTDDGIDRALPISCFLIEPEDNMESIIEKLGQAGILAKNSGGVAVGAFNLRTIGQLIANNRGETSGQVALLSPTDKLTSVVAQGSNRKGASAIYFKINSAEIHSILDVRDPIKQSSHTYSHSKIGIILTKDFMQKVIKAYQTGENQYIDLVTPCNVGGKKSEKKISSENVIILFEKLLKARSGSGDYYIMFEDNVNEALKPWQKELGLEVSMSNLCTEILLPTSIDYNGKKRDAVCCLLQLNVANYNEWEDDEIFIYDVLAFADRILDVFKEIAIAKGYEEAYKHCIYSTEQERSVGIGVMGVYTYFQKAGILIDSVKGKDEYELIFNNIAVLLEHANEKLGAKRGNFSDYNKYLNKINRGHYNYVIPVSKRNSNVTAIAPTATSSRIANVSPSIEPFTTNIYAQTDSLGTNIIINGELLELLVKYGKDNDETYSQIIKDEGSVKNLDFLSDHEKLLFRTYQEYPDMRKLLIDQVAVAQKYIDQGISLNFEYKINADGLVDLNELARDVIYAYSKGIKTLYYTHIPEIKNKIKADDLGGSILKKVQEDKLNDITLKEEACLSCQ